jgi:hypothetical protein
MCGYERNMSKKVKSFFSKELQRMRQRSESATWHQPLLPKYATAPLLNHWGQHHFCSFFRARNRRLPSRLGEMNISVPIRYGLQLERSPNIVQDFEYKITTSPFLRPNISRVHSESLYQAFHASEAILTYSGIG